MQLDAKVNYVAVMHCVGQPAFPGQSLIVWSHRLPAITRRPRWGRRDPGPWTNQTKVTLPPSLLSPPLLPLSLQQRANVEHQRRRLSFPFNKPVNVLIVCRFEMPRGDYTPLESGVQQGSWRSSIHEMRVWKKREKEHYESSHNGAPKEADQ